MLSYLITSIALATLPNPHGPIYSAPWLMDDGVVFRASFSSWGQRLPDDENTISHVTWDGTQLVDSKGNAWTMMGSVPQVPASGPFMPARAGAGPFSETNYYSLANLFNFTGDWTGCVVYTVPHTTGGYVLLSTGSSNGWFVQVNPGIGNVVFQYNHAPNALASTTPLLAGTLQPNITCFGRSGNTIISKTNGGNHATNTVPVGWTPGTDTIRLGRHVGGGWAVGGHIFEVWATTTPASNANFTAIQDRFFGHYADTGQKITVARNSTATYVSGGKLYTVPPNTLRINENGALVEPGRTNHLLQSAAPAGQSVTLATGAHCAWTDGGSVAVTAGTAVVTGLPCAPNAFCQCPFNVSAGGTVSVAFAGGPVRAQVENGPQRTSFIASGATAAARQADNVTAPIAGVSAAEGCAAIDIYRPFASTASGEVYMRALSSNGPFYCGGDTCQNVVNYDGTTVTAQSADGYSSTPIRFRSEWGAGYRTMERAGRTASIVATNNYSLLSEIRIGSAAPNVSVANAYLSNIVIGRSVSGCPL